ncbi:RNA polymerase I-specific transcription initiation factor RRN6-like protein [Xylariomycetidae sp. FL2044]|nr:RNA polymerase I-specific transcription initiation factor RRN6-like protein [Xylariomycetidae sp. FL2044]
MADRHTTESSVGLAGRLSHIPYEFGKAEECGWQSSRDFALIPTFKKLGPPVTWIPPAQLLDQNLATDTPYRASRKQERWLLRSHPEAHLGNSITHELLLETNSMSRHYETSSHAPLLAVGELTDMSNLQKAQGAPLLATVTGPANDVLRLSMPNLVDWQWSENNGLSLRLAEIGQEEPTLIKGENAGSIRRLKCIVDHKRYDPTRWLIVQRDTGTQVFQPEYQLLPMISQRSQPGGSHITPNILFSISKDQTGGESHCDAAFNPSTRLNPPQLAVIDEKGYWSIWDIRHTRVRANRKPQVSLYKRGHIQVDVTEAIRSRAVFKPQWHKILWVGSLADRYDDIDEMEVEEENPESGIQRPWPQLERSSLLLVSNFKSVRLFDLSKDIYLPDLSFTRQDSPDRIVDVDANPHDPQHFYVLTTTKLFVVRISTKTGEAWNRQDKQWSIVLSCPHFRDTFDPKLKLCVAPGARSTLHVTTLVSVYSSESAWLDLFTINASKGDHGLVSFHKEACDLSDSPGANGDAALHTISLIPATISLKSHGSLSEMARDIVHQKVRLYQLAFLRSDMSVASILCASAATQVDRIVHPQRRIDLLSRSSKERKKFVKYMSTRFVIPDDVALVEAPVPEIGHVSGRAKSYPNPQLKRDLKAILEQVQAMFESKTGEQAGERGEPGRFGAEPFDTAHVALEEGLEEGSIPAKTLLQLMDKIISPRNITHASDTWRLEIERLDRIAPEIVSLELKLLGGDMTDLENMSLQEIFEGLVAICGSLEFSGRSSYETSTVRSATLRQIACDLYLSLRGIVYRGVEPIQDSQPHSPAATGLSDRLDDMVIDSQPESLPSSPLRARSVELGAASLKANARDTRGEDPAMTLLRSYTGTGQFVPDKQSALLDKWQVGASLDDYTFDLDRSNEATPGMQRRAKQLARQSRKRRRAETLLGMARGPELPATQPAGQTHFFSSQRSQPMGEYSQSQAILSDPLHPLQTMSQPVVGAFGQRSGPPKKKVKKRKGGF